MRAPTVFRRQRDRRWICVIRTAAGRPVMRGTGKRDQAAAVQWAELLQRDVMRRAEAGDLLPPPALPRKSKVKPCPSEQ